MSRLPKSLQPWARQLELLSHDLAMALGPWLQRISATLGSMAVTRSAITGAPDGYDGVTRRGTYERLLSTEWLLADELPDEFLRRAAAREHQFHNLAITESQGERKALVLFDAGPDQLGTPRIAQLATLLVLAARAEAAGATLVWSTLQNGTRHQGLSAGEVQAFLNERSPHDPTAEQLESALAEPADERWVMGGPRVQALKHRLQLSRVEVTESRDPNQASVLMAAHTPGRAARKIELTLPSPEICTRLLRNPFAPLEPQPRSGRIPTNSIDSMVLASTGAHVFLRDREGHFIMVTKPGPTGRRTSRRLVVEAQAEPRQVFVAAGWQERRVVTLSVEVGADGSPSALIVRRFSKRGLMAQPEQRLAVPSEFVWSPNAPLTSIVRVNTPNDDLWANTNVVPFEQGFLQFGDEGPRASSFVACRVLAWRAMPNVRVELTVAPVSGETLEALQLRIGAYKRAPAVAIECAAPAGTVRSLGVTWVKMNDDVWSEEERLVTFNLKDGEPVAAHGYTVALVLQQNGHRLVAQRADRALDDACVQLVSKHPIRRVAAGDGHGFGVALDSEDSLLFFDNAVRHPSPIVRGRRLPLSRWRFEVDDETTIATYLAAGQTIACVQWYLQAHGCSLAEAREAVDAHQRALAAPHETASTT